MYKGAALEVAHAGRDLRGHVHEHDGAGHAVAAAGAQVVQQVAARHELRDDVERRLARAHAQQLHQVRVPHLLHDGRLLQEVLQRHRVVLQRLHRHLHTHTHTHRRVTTTSERTTWNQQDVRNTKPYPTPYHF